MNHLSDIGIVKYDISAFKCRVARYRAVRPVDQNLQAKEKIGKRKRTSSQAIYEYKYAKNANMTKSQKYIFFPNLKI